jgi:hypothetical protein
LKINEATEGEAGEGSQSGGQNMTTQTKTFIELSDIIGIKVECGGCGSTVTLPIKREMSFKGMGIRRVQGASINLSERYIEK